MAQQEKYMSITKQKRLYEQMLRSHIQAIVNLRSRTGKSGLWPMPIFKETVEIEVYSTPFIIDNFWQMLKGLQNKGLTPTDIGKLYRYPSRLGRFPFTFRERALWPLSQEQKQELGYNVAEILSTMYYEDVFCKKGKNIIYSNKEIKDILLQAQKYSISKDDLNKLKVLSGTLWMLAESFHPRYENSFFEFSGPYKLGNTTIILKEYHNLRPDYLSLDFGHQCANITIIEEYQGDVQCSFDIHNRFKASDQNYKKLKNFYVIADSKYVSVAGLKKLINATQKILSKSVSLLQSLNRQGIITFNGEGEFFCFIEPLARRLKKSWRPPKAFYEKVKNMAVSTFEQEVIDWFKRVPKSEKGWHEIFDLRIDPFK